jgi:hypothetical protein
MAGKPKSRAKAAASKKAGTKVKTHAKVEPAPVVDEQSAAPAEVIETVGPDAPETPAPEVAPIDQEAAPDPDAEPVPEPDAETVIQPPPTADDRPVMHFGVPRPGFIPDGVRAEGVAGSPTIVQGFIPDPHPGVAEALAADPDFGLCPYGGAECADFRDRPDPEASVAAHVLSKHG